jgi:hypothetical protein
VTPILHSPDLTGAVRSRDGGFGGVSSGWAALRLYHSSVFGLSAAFCQRNVIVKGGRRSDLIFRLSIPAPLPCFRPVEESP